MKNIIRNESGVVPIAIYVAIAIISLLSALGVGFCLGTGTGFTAGVIVGVACLIIIPNLQNIIKWFNSVKKEIND